HADRLYRASSASAIARSTVGPGEESDCDPIRSKCRRASQSAETQARAGARRLCAHQDGAWRGLPLYSCGRAKLKRLLPDSLAGRVTLVLVLGLTISHLASLAVYQTDLLRELGVSDEWKLADRLATAERVIASVANPDRDRTAHAISGRGLEIHWSTI